MKPTRIRKPNLLVMLTFFVSLGVIATSVAQAGESIMSTPSRTADNAKPESWWQSIWGLDLARKLKDWRPRITPAEHGEGFNIANPFGNKGPTLQFTSAMPDSVQRSLRDGGDTRIGNVDGETDAYLFIQKRW